MGVHSEDRGFYLKAVPGGTFALLYKQGYDSENQNSEYIYTHICFLNLYLTSCFNS